MKFFKLILIVVILFSSFANAIEPFGCFECISDPKKCEIGQLTCKGRISRDEISTPFSYSPTFGPDDDFTPSAAIFFREIFAVNDAYDYGFYAYYCGDKDFRFLASLLNWENVPPLYKHKAIDEREELLFASEPISVDLKAGRLRIEATCEYTKAIGPKTTSF